MDDGVELTLNGYNPYGTVMTAGQPELVNALQGLTLESEVIAKAIEIFYSIGTRGSATGYIPRTKSVKGSRKARCMFYCTFMAYIQLGYPVDPSYAADAVGLTRSEVEQAFNEYAPSGAILIEPEQLLRFYINRLNSLSAPHGIEYNVGLLEQQAIKVIKTCRGTPAGLEWIQNTAAKVIAVVALYFYMVDIKGYKLDSQIEIFETACYLSWACIRRYHELITKYYNMEAEPTTQRKLILPFF